MWEAFLDGFRLQPTVTQLLMPGPGWLCILAFFYQLYISWRWHRWQKPRLRMSGGSRFGVSIHFGMAFLGWSKRLTHFLSYASKNASSAVTLSTFNLFSELSIVRARAYLPHLFLSEKLGSKSWMFLRIKPIPWSPGPHILLYSMEKKGK